MKIYQIQFFEKDHLCYCETLPIAFKTKKGAKEYIKKCDTKKYIFRISEITLYE